MQKRYNTTPLIITLAGLFGTVLTIMSKDNIIMYHGVRAFRNVMMMTGVLSAGSSVATTVYTFLYFAGKRKQEWLGEQDLRIIDEQKEIEAQKQARLSVNKDIDPQDLRSELQDQKSYSWAVFGPAIDELIAQFDKMDSYQERFHKLLMDNGVNTLGDTEDVINQVEQYMCRNVRSVVNFMMVADTDATGKAGMEEKLTKCIGENKGLLEQTRDFIYAMTEFLNDQGGKADTRLLESYKDTLLNTIRKDSIL
ncbi:MAG: hypothetical protein IKQ27_06865 [Lachnospiraceae bacterium]|nr:hypothetical protein [Lachnospiraceae bacterium]